MKNKNDKNNKNKNIDNEDNFGLSHGKRPKPRRKEDPLSPRNIENERLRKLGLIINEDVPWRDADFDLLLECYLVHLLKWEPITEGFFTTTDCIRDRMKRSYDSCMSYIRKLGMNYNKEDALAKNNIQNYKPILRTDRTGSRFITRDWYIICRSCSMRGMLCGANNPVHLAKILGRSQKEVKDRLSRFIKVVSQQTIQKMDKETQEKYRNRIIYAAFRSFIDTDSIEYRI